MKNMIVAAAIFALSLLATSNYVFAKPDISKLSCQKAYRTPIDETTSKILIDRSIRTIHGDVFQSDDYVQYNGTIEGCVCHLKTCIRKCCPEGVKLIHEQCNEKFKVLKGLAIPDKIGPSLSNFHVTYGMDCGSSNRLLYMIDARESGEFYISKEGVLTLADASSFYFFDYCLDYTEKDEVVTIVCDKGPEDPKASAMFSLFTAGMIISTPFFLITFIVYALLPEKNIYNGLLMCYAMSKMLSNIIQVFIRLIPITRKFSICPFMGTSCYFFYLVSLCSFNVIAYDIWSTFKNIRAPAMSKSKKGKKRMLFYSLYVVGIPLFMVVVVITLTTTSKVTAWYNPNMGVGKCWVSGSTAEFTYFYLLLIINVLISTSLFVSTARHIKKIKNDTKGLEGEDSQKHEKGKKLFIVYVKLCFVMGISLALFLTITLVDALTGSKIPIVILCLACVPFPLDGVFIFFFFVFKKNIWKQLKKKI